MTDPHDPQAPRSGSVTQDSSPYTRGDLSTLTYRAVDLMLASAHNVTPDTPLIVASVSDAENVETSSPLGNSVADMIRTRVVQDGHTALEIRLRKALNFNKGQGEFMLFRNRHALMPAPSAAAVVTSTYTVFWDTLYVSLRLVYASDAHIISGADFVVPLLRAWNLLHTTGA